jgi:hypothetical protein
MGKEDRNLKKTGLTDEQPEVMKIFNDFLNELHKLTNAECWAVAAGEGTGSRITLQCGRKIERARPLTNPNVSEALRRFKGEYVIFVQDCAWRLESNEVVCTSKSPNNNDGPMVAALRSLEGHRIIAVSATSPAHGLVVEFYGALKLHLFCDCFDEAHDGSNYSFHSPAGVFVSGAGGTLTYQPRQKAQSTN